MVQDGVTEMISRAKSWAEEEGVALNIAEVDGVLVVTMHLQDLERLVRRSEELQSAINCVRDLSDCIGKVLKHGA